MTNEKFECIVAPRCNYFSRATSGRGDMGRPDRESVGMHARTVPTGSPGRADEPAGTNVMVRFVEWIKPYKEFVAIGGSAVVMLSGGVSWAVSHFATVEQLSHLECRISLNISIQSLPLQSSMISMKLDGKWAHVAYLMKDESTVEAKTKIEQARQEIKDLQEERKKVDALYQQEVAAAPVRCSAKK